ncbi:MAG: hypothetical protein Q9214_000259 [Letrouitia sp. 1 TL-2023]
MTWFSSIKFKAINLFSEKVVRVFSYSIDHIIGTLWLAMFALSLFPKGKDFKHLFDTPPYATWSTAAALAVVLSALFYWTGLFTCNPPDPEAFLGPTRAHDFERLGIIETPPVPPYWRHAMERNAAAEAAARPTTATTAPTSTAPTSTAPTSNSDPDAIELQDMSVPNKPRANASSRAVIYK